MNKKYWFITYNIRKVTTKGPHERVANEAIDIHPVDWIYKMNRDNVEYFTLLHEMPICVERFEMLQKDCMTKGTRSFKRPRKGRPTW